MVTDSRRSSWDELLTLVQPLDSADWASSGALAGSARAPSRRVMKVSSSTERRGSQDIARRVVRSPDRNPGATSASCPAATRPIIDDRRIRMNLSCYCVGAADTTRAGVSHLGPRLVTYPSPERGDIRGADVVGLA
jgi:hypothetical protein